MPYVLGKKINLRKLYINVIKRGGYKKVNENNEWEDVLGDLNLPKETTNCELAIQTIYHRYLEEYEREQWNALNSGSYSDSFSSTTNNNNHHHNSDNNNSIDIDLSKHSSYISDLALRDKSFLAAFINVWKKIDFVSLPPQPISSSQRSGQHSEGLLWLSTYHPELRPLGVGPQLRHARTQRIQPFEDGAAVGPVERNRIRSQHAPHHVECATDPNRFTFHGQSARFGAGHSRCVRIRYVQGLLLR